MFALGRERVLPAALGRTSHRTGSPVTGSIIQSVVGLAVIIIYAIGGWDPVLQLFFWGGTAGGMGVLALITITSIAVVAFFSRNAYGETTWRRLIAPVLATLVLLVVMYLAVKNFATLLGVPADHPLRWGVPIAYVIIAILGILWGLALRSNKPDVYATIGLGARSATAATLGGAHEARV
jgi:amino acid transporter